jgi:hypothetical protein
MITATLEILQTDEPILIPESATELADSWALFSSLRQVVFECPLSLRVMIETNNVDLSGRFQLRFVERDYPFDFRGYSVETPPTDVACLAEISLQT